MQVPVSGVSKGWHINLVLSKEDDNTQSPQQQQEPNTDGRKGGVTSVRHRSSENDLSQILDDHSRQLSA